MGMLDNWFKRQAEREAKSDVLKKSDRFSNIVGIVGILICLAYLAALANMQSGFFISSFGTVSGIIFFGSAGWGLIASSVRLVTGRKSPSKIFDIIGSVLVLIAAIYFLASFQFDFTHFADALPGSLKFILQWISDGLVKILLSLGVIVLVFVIPFQILSYRYLRTELSRPQPAPASIPEAPQNQEAPKQ
jgi:hypothetical protein